MAAYRRQVPRYLSDLPAQISQPPGTTPLKATVVNISVSGCSLEGAASLTAQKDCEITIEWEGREFRAEATVTWKSGKGEAGVRFLLIDPANQELLKKICSNLYLQPLTRAPQK